MTPLVLHLPTGLITCLDDLVTAGYYPNRSEAIRMAIRDLVNSDFARAYRASSARSREKARTLGI